MRFFCEYVSQCIYSVAQDNSSSSVAQRCQKVGHRWLQSNAWLTVSGAQSVYCRLGGREIESRGQKESGTGGI